ncbi:hypothetical protein BDFG_02105 [Blastomyces dermatitidis ATCC 26199]|nr:hypothetical protein BDFG_02105 [Blastomyces dermatitidis ATCC 26199]
MSHGVWHRCAVDRTPQTRARQVIWRAVRPVDAPLRGLERCLDDSTPLQKWSSRIQQKSAVFVRLPEASRVTDDQHQNHSVKGEEERRGEECCIRNPPAIWPSLRTSRRAAAPPSSLTRSQTPPAATPTGYSREAERGGRPTNGMMWA